VYQITYEVLIFIILYILPMTLIFYTYTRVIKVLWKIDNSITWDNENGSKTLKVSRANSRNKSGSSANSHSNFTMACGTSKAKTKIMQQLNARRKAAKMLISVAVIFALCYLAIYLLNHKQVDPYGEKISFYFYLK